MKIIVYILIGLSSLVFANFIRVEGVVKDNTTNLEWQDDYSDNTNNEVKILSWKEAIDYCETLTLDNGEWRLPNRNELLSLVDYTLYNPSISSIFIKTKTVYTSYWSSTYHSHTSSNGYIFASSVDFSTGFLGTGRIVNTRYSVRCVRSF